MNLHIFEVEVCLDWIYLKSKTQNDEKNTGDDRNEAGHSCSLRCCAAGILLCSVYGLAQWDHLPCFLPASGHPFGHVNLIQGRPLFYLIPRHE